MFTLLVAERNTPCASILLAVDRGTHCTSILLVVERNTLCIKTLDPDWIEIGIQPKMLDPEPYQMTTDLKHWSLLQVAERNTPSTSILLAGERFILAVWCRKFTCKCRIKVWHRHLQSGTAGHGLVRHCPAMVLKNTGISWLYMYSVRWFSTEWQIKSSETITGCLRHLEDFPLRTHTGINRNT